MSQTLSYRVSRLISGGFHALLDKAEDLAPQVAFNEHLRELDKAIDEVRAELGKTLAQKHLTLKKLADDNTRHDTLNDQITTAMSLGREDLASVGIGEQIGIEARLSAIENTIADCTDKEKELEGFIVALQAKRREIQTVIDDFIKMEQTKSNGLGLNTGSNLDKIAQKVDKTANAFDRVMSRQTGLNHQTSQNANAQGLKELEELSRNNRVAERLAKLKAGQSS